MGVDYSANFGFGIQIKRTEKDFERDFIGELYSALEGSKYKHFEAGEGLYDGSINDTFVIVDKEYLNLGKLEEEAEDLINFLDAKGIEYIGTPDIVGGLLVW